MAQNDDVLTAYCDPILKSHLGTEADSFYGTSFFSYVHPEELDRCKSDFKRIVDQRALNGDAMRVRYCRVPEIRRRLGCQAPDIAPNARAYVFDDNYLTIEVTINWVGAGMLLAFYHAVIGQY